MSLSKEEQEYLTKLVQAAQQTVQRWTHQGRCRICDESMENLKAVLLEGIEKKITSYG